MLATNRVSTERAPLLPDTNNDPHHNSSGAVSEAKFKSLSAQTNLTYRTFDDGALVSARSASNKTGASDMDKNGNGFSSNAANADEYLSRWTLFRICIANFAVQVSKLKSRLDT